MVVVRLGGIYALEGAMNTSDQYYQPVLKSLSAFVRDAAKPPAIGQLPPTNTSVVHGRGSRKSSSRLVTVRLLSPVIGHRSAGQGRVNLSGAFIAGANLNHADLSNADLRGVNLSRANLLSANLNNADLLGADLTGATWTVPTCV